MMSRAAIGIDDLVAQEILQISEVTPKFLGEWDRDFPRRK
jgi:hypothetical protein